MSERGEYRAIRRVLLDGKDFQLLSANARWVFVALKLNLGPTGIDVQYREALICQLAEQTGLAAKAVGAALEELEGADWVRFERNVVWVVGQLEHEPSLAESHPKHRKSIRNHVDGLPRLAIVGAFIDKYGATWIDGFGELRQKYPKTSDSLGKGSGKPSDRHRDQKTRKSDTTEDTTEDRIVGADAPDLALVGDGTRPSKPAGNWVAEATALYAEHIGQLEPGRVGRALKTLVGIHGWPVVRSWLEAYCKFRPYQKADGDFDVEGEKRAHFCSIEGFAQTSTVWRDLIDPNANQGVA